MRGPLLRLRRFVHFLAVELRDTSDAAARVAILEDKTAPHFGRALDAELAMSLADSVGTRPVEFHRGPWDDDARVLRIERELLEQLGEEPLETLELLEMFSDPLGGEDVLPLEPPPLLSADERRRARNKRKALERRARGG